MQHEPNKKRRPDGFTLVELMLVLVILGTLAAIVVPRFTGRAEKAKITAARTDISSIELAMNMYEVENGGFPSTEDGLLALVENLEDKADWGGPYLEKGIPVDPWGNDYIYEYPGRYNPDGFDLFSMGPDEQEGTEDDVVNWVVETR